MKHKKICLKNIACMYACMNISMYNYIWYNYKREKAIKCLGWFTIQVVYKLEHNGQ